MSNAAIPTPQVSIGMPVFNGEPFIREALNSLLAQTYTEFELIISDNASTDGTEAICREYAAKDKRIRYVRQPTNRGATANFQFVVDEAVGEYFMWAAADDRHHKDFIKITKHVLDAEPEVGLVFTGMQTINLLSNAVGSRSTTGFVSFNRKPLKILFRLLQLCPSLIYGLHRKKILWSLNLASYDYFDCYLGLWYEMYSSVRIVPMYLYTAGTVGDRIPYSLIGKYIDSKRYRREVRRLLNSELNLLPTVLLCLLNWYIIRSATRRHNQQIRLDSFASA
jgi:glycosyltransferase involved in cell wall biosynthesis